MIEFNEIQFINEEPQTQEKEIKKVFYKFKKENSETMKVINLKYALRALGFEPP